MKYHVEMYLSYQKYINKNKKNWLEKIIPTKVVTFFKKYS